MIDFKNLGQVLYPTTVTGTVSTTAQTPLSVFMAPFGGWITNIYAKVGTTVSGTNITTFDININGTSIYSGTTTQLAITGTNSVVGYGTLTTDPPRVEAGDLITVDNDGALNSFKDYCIYVLIDRQNPKGVTNVADLSALR